MSDFLKVEKRILFFFAAAIWIFAGFRVFSIGIGDVNINGGTWTLAIVFATIVFFMFYNFIFSKMYIKHSKRIINSQLEKHFFLGFFDIKGYIIMAFMITLGIVVRSSGIFNPIYVGGFYIGLGFALFIAGVLFLRGAINFEDTKEKYIGK